MPDGTTDAGTGTTDTGTTGTTDTTATTDATKTAAAAGDSGTTTTTTDTTAKPDAGATLVVPEKYELKLADGLKVDPAIVEKTAATARTLGLSNEKAQDLLNFTAAEIAATQASELESNSPGGTAYTARVQGWEQAALADPEIGGTVAKLNANVEQAKKVLGTFGDEQIAKFLNETGFGSHPSVIKMFAKLGKGMSEGSFLTGDTSKSTEAMDPATKLYGDGTKKKTTSQE
jgi:hypothetical protein